MKILLTGADGQLGRSLQAQAGAHTVTAVDIAQLDIADLTAVREAVGAERPDIILNAAAFNDVDGAEADGAPAYRGNALGPRNLAVASAEHGIPILHVSTDYVFDGTSQRPYHEFDQTNPQSVYGRSKLAGENAVRELNPRHYVVRTAWLYHPVGRNFPNTMRALSDRAEVRVVSDQYGSPTYAPHLAAAILTLVETEAFGTFHFAGRGGTSWFEMTRTLYRLLGIGTAVHPVSTAEFPRPAPRPRYSVLTTAQSPEILLPAWEEGLAEYARRV